MHRLRTVCFLALLAAGPLAASAYYLKPSELLSTLKYKGEPMAFAYDLHGNADDIVCRVSIKGATQGTTAETVKLNLQLAADIAGFEGADSIHAKARLRMTNATLYVLLEGLDGSYRPEMLHGIMQQYGGRWYALDTGTATSLAEEYTDASSAEAKALAMDILDSILTLTRTAATSGNTYSLELKPDAAKIIAGLAEELRVKYPSLAEQSTTVSTADTGEMRAFFSRINFHTKVLTDVQEKPRAVKTYFSITWGDNTKGEGVFVGQAKLRKAPVSVAIPKNAIDVSSQFSGPLSQASSSCSRTPCALRPSTRKTAPDTSQ